MLKSRPRVPKLVPAVRKMESSAGTWPWTNWSADCSSSIVTVAPLLDEEDEDEDEGEDEDEDGDEDEDPEVMVLDSSASNLDEEFEHRKAPIVMASEATEAILPSLTNVAPLAAVKGAPRGLVAALSLKAWQTAVGSTTLAATACCGVVKSWSRVTVIWIEASPSPVLIWTWMVLPRCEERGSAVARLVRREAEENRREVLMMSGWRIWGCKCSAKAGVWIKWESKEYATVVR
jgi:hypothetical protein